MTTEATHTQTIGDLSLRSGWKITFLRWAAVVCSSLFLAACGAAPEGDTETATGTTDVTAADDTMATADDSEGPDEVSSDDSENPEVMAGGHTNPLSPFLGFKQLNSTDTWGSCGSHSGGVAIGYLRGYHTTAQDRQVESDLYWHYGGRVHGGPGLATLANTYNKYMTAHGVPYKAFTFGDSSAVYGRIQAGTPVVAHTAMWGGHYVCIRGLRVEGGVWKVYFSDGIYHDGVSAVLPVGYLKRWNWSSLRAYIRAGYIGFSHK